MNCLTFPNSFWLIAHIKLSMNILILRKLWVVRERKAASKTSLFSLKASPKYVVFSILSISQPLPLFCASLECALEDESYEDGAETQVECNRCVCACGNWVCTAMTCEGLYALTLPLGLYKGIFTFYLSESTSYPGWFSLQLFLSFNMGGFCITLPCSTLAKPKLVLF